MGKKVLINFPVEMVREVGKARIVISLKTKEALNFSEIVRLAVFEFCERLKNER
jgi:hypothetical protein